MKKRYFDNRYFVIRTYRSKDRRYRKKWVRKKAKDKRGLTRYSSGQRWTGTYLPENVQYYYRYMPKHLRNANIVLSSGYTSTQTWIALCKSWNGFRLSKLNGEVEDMKKFAGYIRKLAKDLGYEPPDFAVNFTPEEVAEIDRKYHDENDEDVLRIRYGTVLGF